MKAKALEHVVKVNAECDVYIEDKSGERTKATGFWVRKNRRGRSVVVIKTSGVKA